MANKLFVGGLPFDFTDDKLRELFTPLGTVVSAVMVPDPKHGRTRGFGFVAMSSEEESLSAIESLKGLKIGEKTIWVTEAREKPQQARPPQTRTSRPASPFSGSGTVPPERKRWSGRPEGFPQAPRWEGRRLGGTPSGRPSGPPRGRGNFDGPPRGQGSFDRPSDPPRSRGRNEPYRFQERSPRSEGNSSFPSSRPQGGFERRPPSRDAKPGAWRGPRPTSFGDRRPRPDGNSGPRERTPFPRKPFGRGPAPYSPDSKPFGRGPKPYGRGPSPSRGPSRFSDDRGSSNRPPRSGKPGGPDPAHHKFGKFFKKPSRPSDRGDRPDGPPRRSGPRH